MFEAFPKHHSMTVSSNINILAGPAYWSAIKTLPATLPEPRSVVGGSSFEDEGPSFTDHDPVATDHGPGLLELFLPQIWMSVGGGGRYWVEALVPSTLALRLAKAVEHDFVQK